ncbi:MAG: ATP-binding cassette domain-containing protein [Myxococcales bacterium]|nr:ATP-binding cassette domain-containing protein [Myxococcales bacterium]
MIKVDNLVKYYDTFQALKNVSFTVNKGEILGFLGPNGAGKTTCMKILTGYMPPTSGSASINGMDIRDDSLTVRQILGYLPESTPLYTDMMVGEFLAYVAAIREIPDGDVKARITEVAKTCDLKAFINKSIGQLSKGQRQRVGLAQAMIHRPQYLVLDEPTSGLDPNQIIEIRELIRELGKDRTIILSTHNLPEVRATCNKMLIIHEGKIVLHGSPEELEEQHRQAPRVIVKIASGNGELKKTDVRKKLDQSTAFTRVVEKDDEGNGVFSFEIEGQKGEGDLRRVMFQYVVAQNWVLLEMRQQEMNIENIFRQLTK